MDYILGESIPVFIGLTSRPGLPCLRAAVGPYLFHWSGMCSTLAKEIIAVVMPGTVPGIHISR